MVEEPFEGVRGLGAANLKEVATHVKTCQWCRLAKTRTRAVPGEGYGRAEVLFIGEGPGYREDKEGRPFVGPAGHFLNELLEIAGLERETAFITNVVKCRPPNNRDPMPDEIAACSPYLERQIELIDPRLIVTLGRHSMARFFPGERISQIHGTARVVGGRLCVAMYHPAAGLHQASLADVIRADFRKLPAFMQQSRLMRKPASTSELPAEQEEADEIHNAVVHEVATGQVIHSDSDVLSASTPQTETEPEVDAFNAPVGSVAPVPPPARTRGKKPKKPSSSYEQMSFLDN